MNEKYYKELTRILAKNGIEAAPPEKNTLPILLGGRSACRVEPSGDVCIFPDDIRSPEADELYHRVAPFSRMVKEYMTAIERAPLLKATALDEDFKLLAEFNGAVFAGRETEYGYMFVTWKRDYKGTGVCNGGYFLDGYEAAKQDFAIRTGLIEKQRLFSDTQLLDIYQSVNDTFEAGYPAWTDPTTVAASNADIISSLGLGIVRFNGAETEPVEVDTIDYEYRVNTEVITAVTVSGGQSDPDDPVSVKFNINGTTYTVSNVYYPSDDSQLAWVKWTTPDTEQDMVITVTVTGSGRTSNSTINVRIVDLDKNEPPNPVADDRNDSFSYSSVPSRAVQSLASWGVWSPWWYENWVWYGDDEDGYWVDEGEWEFDYNSYTAKLTSTMNIVCDSKNPTASGDTMKSGYVRPDRALF